MVRHKQPATYADIEALPPNWVGEMIGDRMVAFPRPAWGHTRVASVLGGVLGGAFDFGSGGPGGWWILDEPELHFGYDVLVPDLAGWRRERMPAPPAPETPYVTLAPDWVCEVLSPSTAQHDRVDKLAVYAREGVANVWFIDPLARTLEVLRRTPDGWLLALTARGGQQVQAEPFQALALGLAALWGGSSASSG